MDRATELSTDCVVIGGGFFGSWLALALRRRGVPRVMLLERDRGLLSRASYNNQARVHNGYHYPRSILTGLRSRVNSSRFLAEFADCVDTQFKMYYCVARLQSNVTAAQFKIFCERIGAPLSPARDAVAAMFDKELVEAVFHADEWAFDAERLARRLRGELDREGVDVRYGCEALRVTKGESARARLVVDAKDRDSGEPFAVGARFAFNCTYSNLNGVLARSGVAKIPLKQELAEIALVEVPKELERVGVTMMCGPFFSFMPFPARRLHSFSHVRYTPHHSWRDVEIDLDNQAYMDRIPKQSSFVRMRTDARRYMPIVERFVQKGSLFELKTVLPQSELDDSRPILFRKDESLAGLTSVLGGKIDNVYDVERELDPLLAESAEPSWR